MPKDLKNLVEIYNGKYDQLTELLKQGKTILGAVKIGPILSEALEKGYSDIFQAKIELKERKTNAGVCGCGETADALIYLWRD